MEAVMQKPKRRRQTWREETPEHYMLEVMLNRLEPFRFGLQDPSKWTQLHSTRTDGSGHYVFLERKSGKPAMIPDFLDALEHTGVIEREHFMRSLSEVRKLRPEWVRVFEWFARRVKIQTRGELLRSLELEGYEVTKSTLYRWRDRVMQAIWQGLPDEIRQRHPMPDVLKVHDEESEVDA